MNADDRELLELAANAAGFYVCDDIEFLGVKDLGPSLWVKQGKYETYKPWNSLTDDGDALRLAIAVGAFKTIEEILSFRTHIDCARLIDDCDETAAFRIAATYYAAEIGKSIT